MGSIAQDSVTKGSLCDGNFGEMAIRVAPDSPMF
jgi:hypothetical protein